MSALEDRLRQTLKGSQPIEAAPDLFARVHSAIDQDRHRRRRIRTTVAAWTIALACGAALVIGLTPRQEGRLAMNWVVLEVGKNVVLVGIALWLGPFIKRFGRAYAADVFHDNPRTGKSYIVLTDVVYYLIFAAYILIGVQYAPPGIPETVTAQQLALVTTQVGGILLIIGVLHGLNIVLMPVLGRLFSLNRRLPDVTD